MKTFCFVYIHFCFISTCLWYDCIVTYDAVTFDSILKHYRMIVQVNDSIIVIRYNMYYYRVIKARLSEMKSCMFELIWPTSYYINKTNRKQSFPIGRMTCQSFWVLHHSTAHATVIGRLLASLPPPRLWLADPGSLPYMVKAISQSAPLHVPNKNTYSSHRRD